MRFFACMALLLLSSNLVCRPCCAFNSPTIAAAAAAAAAARHFQVRLQLQQDQQHESESFELLQHETNNNDDEDDDNKGSCLAIEKAMDGLGFKAPSKVKIMMTLKQSELVEEDGSADNLMLFARDFEDRPEMLSSLLQSDFGFAPLMAHQVRAIIREVLQLGSEHNSADPKPNTAASASAAITTMMATTIDSDTEDQPSEIAKAPVMIPIPANGVANTEAVTDSEVVDDVKVTHYNWTIVNKKAQKRHKNAGANYGYGLSTDFSAQYPTIASELDEFLSFMINPTPFSQESPIRPATAEVYLSHTKQFLGWYLQRPSQNQTAPIASKPDDSQLSLTDVVPNKEKESASTIIEFILWLRSTRDISVSYEANFLRGLIKLLKFRFSKESTSDPSYGGKSYDDIPIIREIRKVHRDANQRQKVAPRSSDEQTKWLSWPEYLNVIESTKTELEESFKSYEELPESDKRYGKEDKDRTYCVQQRAITQIFQRYLVLSIFANVPDRQRTIRELEIGRTLQKSVDNGYWEIRHSSDDYKTGKAYGERPAIRLTPSLSAAIDDFIDNWRSSLRPNTDYLFVQWRFGKPLTRDSLYNLVSKTCFQYTGKRTNPHLLRDMIVTHVRGSDASEKQLEALALYMGHSIQTQRTSYDRRTLDKKIAPALELLQNVNANT